MGAYLAAQGDEFLNYLPFLGLTLFFLALPAIGVTLMGERAKLFLPKARDWMNDNAWIVNEAVLLLFVVIIAGNL